MDLIALARELGKGIQQDERYLAFQVARQNSDDDAELQNLIGEFNLKRMAINNEASKDPIDEEKMKQLNKELRQCYSTIMENKNMQNYEESKGELDYLVKRISAIITPSALGEDPETTDLVESSCAGNCSGCSGCH